MIDDNLIMCQTSEASKCISDELFANKKYYTYLLFIFGIYDEEENSIIYTQLIIVTILFFYFAVFFKNMLISFLNFFLFNVLKLKLVKQPRNRVVEIYEG